MSDCLIVRRGGGVSGGGFDLLGMQYVQSHAPQYLGLPNYLEAGPNSYEPAEYFINRSALASTTNALLIVLQDSYGDAPPVFFWSSGQDFRDAAATVVPGSGANPFYPGDGDAVAAMVSADWIYIIAHYAGRGFEILEIHEFE